MRHRILSYYSLLPGRKGVKTRKPEFSFSFKAQIYFPLRFKMTSLLSESRCRLHYRGRSLFSVNSKAFQDAFKKSNIEKRKLSFLIRLLNKKCMKYM